ncbi:MAG: lactate racemase domain-containing protein [Planctomycetota bacterium]|jgi:hypothetical protein
MEELTLAYGKGSATVLVPKGLVPPDSHLAAHAPSPRDPGSLYRGALDTANFEIVDPVVIVVPDETRPADRFTALNALSGLLTDRSVDVVIGAGLHSAVGFDSSWPCHVHDARSPDLADLGQIEAIPLTVNRLVADAGTVIVVSAVMPHYLAGFSGGPKGLVPGVAGEETILAVHERADIARHGLVTRNPFAQAIRSCAQTIGRGRSYSLNLLVGPLGPFAATAGELIGAHTEAVRLYREACAQPRPEPADVVLVDAGGHPVDATLLQAHKAYEAAADLVKPGGTLVLVAACDEGYGHEEFLRRLFIDDPLEPPFHPYGRTAAEWRRKAKSIRTLMVTELDVEWLGVERVDLDAALARVPAGARVLVAQRAQDLLFHR